VSQRCAAAPIAVQPLGDVPLDQLRLLERILSDAFGAAAVVLRPEPVPARAWSPVRRQHDADVLLDELFARLPERCLRIVGVTDADVYIGGRTFVFGYAHLTDGMALYSLHRLREGFYGRVETTERLTDRVLRAVVHELGHTFGAPHCEDAGCVMRAVSHVETLDALAPRYCAGCHHRVRTGLAVAPWSARGRWERGLAWLRRRDYRRAVRSLEHAVRSAPLDPAYHHDLGVARLAAGDHDGARGAFRRSLELEPDRPRSHAHDGDAVAALGRDDG
jgi:archaemetzincin